MKVQPNHHNPEAAEAIAEGIVASISHDLRTPLSAILLWTKILSEEKNLSREELQQGLRAIRECAEEQHAMIDDIVDSSRIATGRIQLRRERADLVAEFGKVLEAEKASASEQGVTVAGAFDSTLGEGWVDVRRLQQLVRILVANGVARTPKGGNVTLHCRRRAESVEIAVADTGAVMSTDDVRQSIDQFPNGPMPVKSRRHTLYIAARLAALMGAEIEMETGASRGSVFKVKLDLPDVSNTPWPAKTKSETAPALLAGLIKLQPDVAAGGMLHRKNFSIA